MTVQAIVQARMTSTRLPGKVLKEVQRQPLLGLLTERLARALNLDGIVIATTTNPEDDPIVDLAENLELACYRGDEMDVLSRYVGAARFCNATSIVRITGDCPLIDPEIVDRCLGLHGSSGGDYTSNTLVRTYPLGMDVEVFTREALEEAGREASHEEEREHVTPFIYRRPDRFALASIEAPGPLKDPELRLTLDTAEDLELIQLVFDALYPKNPLFSLADILSLLGDHPDWRNINSNVPHRQVSRAAVQDAASATKASVDG